jgi:hypothetical protein
MRLSLSVESRESRESEGSRLGRTTEELRRRGEEKETYCQADGRCWRSEEPLDMYLTPWLRAGMEACARCMHAVGNCRDHAFISTKERENQGNVAKARV